MSHPFDTPVARGGLARVSARTGEPASADEADVDTIEMELLPEDLARLAQIPGAETITGQAQTARPHIAEGQAAEAQAVEAELAAGLAPRRAELPTSPPPPAPLAAELPPQAKNTPVALTDEAQISKLRAVPRAPIRDASVARAQVVPISPARETRTSTPAVKAARTADPSPSPAIAGREMAGKSSGAARWVWVAVLVLFALGAASVWLSSRASLQMENTPLPALRAPSAAIEPQPERVSTPLVAERQEIPTPPAGELVKVRNPFDSGEVFEFPTGTSRTDARQAVAQFLLQRACERERASSAASCGQAATPADLLRQSTPDSQ